MCIDRVRILIGDKDREACLEPEHVGDGAAIMEWQGLPLDKEGGRTGGH